MPQSVEKNRQFMKAIDTLRNVETPSRQALLDGTQAGVEQLDLWLKSRRGRRAIARVKRQLAQMRELDVARAAARAAERLLLLLADEERLTKPADLRAVATTAVQLARASRLRKGAVAANKEESVDELPDIDPVMLAALEAARGERS